jgi:2-polyprenyl-3-methyl-5-hydroxy-6-metoxy-1,4-benzoquinol methylase
MNSSSHKAGRCLWCGGSLLFWRSFLDTNLNLFKKPVGYSRCEACNSIIQYPALSQKELEAAYPKTYWIEGDESSFLKRIALWYQRIILSLDHGTFAKSALGSIKGKTVLEIGGGRGDFLRWAKAKGAVVTGWERSPIAVSLQKSLGLNSIAVNIENISSWPKHRTQFDAICGFHVLEHLTSPTTVVESLAAMLAPGGVLIFQVPNIDSYQSMFFNSSWYAIESPRHVSIPSLRGVHNFAKILKLNIVNMQHFSLRDSAFSIFMSICPNARPHLPKLSGARLLLLLMGTWLCQPFAIAESLSMKGGTITFSLKRHNGVTIK